MSCIPDSKVLDLRFKSKFSHILDPTSKIFLDSGMRIPLHQTTSSLFPAFRSCGVWPEIGERETITRKKELRERESSHSLPHPLAVFLLTLFGSVLNLNSSKTVYDSFVKKFARTDDPAGPAMQATTARTTSLSQSQKRTKKHSDPNLSL